MSAVQSFTLMTSMPRSSSTLSVRAASAAALCVGLSLLLAGCSSAPARPGAVADSHVTGNLPSRDRIEFEETPAPAPRPEAPIQPVGLSTSAPSYTTVFEVRIPDLGIDMPVIDVGVVNGAMDAPGVSNANDPIWKTAFWLNRGAIPGYSGTATIAGHVTDSWARPAGFWAVQRIKVGTIVEITRKKDGVTVRYRISDVQTYTLAQVNSPAVLAHLYGPPGGGVDDGVARLSLVTCTGRFVGNGYDHRLIAYAEMISG
jgi:sortase (surface protein transpeptidase)